MNFSSPRSSKEGNREIEASLSPTKSQENEQEQQQQCGTTFSISGATAAADEH